MTQELAVATQTQELAYTPSTYSTMEITDSETRKIVANAMNNADSLAKHVGPLEVVGVMCRPGINRRQEADGSTTSVPCTDSVLVCSDGSAYFTKSEGIRRCLDSFVALGLFDDGEPIQMEVQSRQVGNRTIKSLVLL